MKPIVGYENYHIYPDGKVINTTKGNEVKQVTNSKNGYLYVSLWKGNMGRTFSVHRLVATYYVPNPKNLEHVNHKDSDRTNPHMDNLEWVTRSENMKHGYAVGWASQDNRRNFTDRELELILEEFLAGNKTVTEIAAEKGVGLSKLTIHLKRIAKQTGKWEAYKLTQKAQRAAINRKANIGSRQKVCQYSLTGELLAVHDSLTEATKVLGKKSSGTISNCLRGRQKTAYGYLWKYA